MTQIEKLKELATEAAPGPWGWWDSCSWRRLTSRDARGQWSREGNILLPVVCSDGHPDIVVSKENREFIEAFDPTTVLSLIAALEAAQGERDAMTKACGGTLKVSATLAEERVKDGEALEAKDAEIEGLKRDYKIILDRARDRGERLDAAEAALKDAREVVSEANTWITNWSPNFEQDDEWPATAAKVRALLSKQDSGER